MARLPETLARLGIPLGPEDLRAGSGGEVDSYETFDWSHAARSGELRPVPRGLFCPEIFGAKEEGFGHLDLVVPVRVGEAVVSCVPVLPPRERPILPRDGTRVAISPWNDLYRRVINRNFRLRKLRELPGVPEDILRREEELLSETVSALWEGPQSVSGPDRRL